MNYDQIRIQQLADTFQFVADKLGKPRESLDPKEVPPPWAPPERAVLATNMVLADGVQEIIVRAIANYQLSVQIAIDIWLDINETSKVHHVPLPQIERARRTNDMCEALLMDFPRNPMDVPSTFILRIEAPLHRDWDRDRCRSHIDDRLDELMTQNEINNYHFVGGPHPK